MNAADTNPMTANVIGRDGTSCKTDFNSIQACYDPGSLPFHSEDNSHDRIHRQV